MKKIMIILNLLVITIGHAEAFQNGIELKNLKVETMSYNLYIEADFFFKEREPFTNYVWGIEFTDSLGNALYIARPRTMADVVGENNIYSSRCKEPECLIIERKTDEDYTCRTNGFIGYDNELCFTYDTNRWTAKGSLIIPLKEIYTQSDNREFNIKVIIWKVKDGKLEEKVGQFQKRIQPDIPKMYNISDQKISYSGLKVKNLKDNKIMVSFNLYNNLPEKSIYKGFEEGAFKSKDYRYFSSIEVLDKDGNEIYQKLDTIIPEYFNKTTRKSHIISLMDAVLSAGRNDLRVNVRLFNSHDKIGRLQSNSINLNHYQTQVYITEINLNRLTVSKDCDADFGKNKKHRNPDVYWILYLNDTALISPYNQDNRNANPGTLYQRTRKPSHMYLEIWDDDFFRDDFISSVKIPVKADNKYIFYNKRFNMIENIDLSYIAYKFEPVEIIVTKKDLLKIDGVTTYKVDFMMKAPTYSYDFLYLWDENNALPQLVYNPDSVYSYKSPAIEGMNYNLVAHLKIKGEAMSHTQKIYCKPIDVNDVDYSFRIIDTTYKDCYNNTLAGVQINSNFIYSDYYKNAITSFYIKMKDEDLKIFVIDSSRIETEFSMKTKTLYNYFIPYYRLKEFGNTETLTLKIKNRKLGHIFGQADTSFTIPIHNDTLNFRLEDFKVPFKYRKDDFAVKICRGADTLYKSEKIFSEKKIIQWSKMNQAQIISNKRDDITIKIIQSRPKNRIRKAKSKVIVDRRLPLGEWMKVKELSTNDENLIFQQETN